MTSPTSDPPEWGAASKVVQLVCEELGGAVIGGVAVSLRSVARFTKDIDAVCWQGERSYQEILDLLVSVGLSPKSSNPVAFARLHRIFPMVHEGSGVGVDISLGVLPFERGVIDRAEPILVDGTVLRIATAEDLVVLKLVAGRPQDLADVASLLAIEPRIDKTYVRRLVTEFAEILGIDDIREGMERALAG